jgi:hypothetical protein
LATLDNELRAAAKTMDVRLLGGDEDTSSSHAK